MVKIKCLPLRIFKRLGNFQGPSNVCFGGKVPIKPATLSILFSWSFCDICGRGLVLLFSSCSVEEEGGWGLIIFGGFVGKVAVYFCLGASLWYFYGVLSEDNNRGAGCPIISMIERLDERFRNKFTLFFSLPRIVNFEVL